MIDESAIQGERGTGFERAGTKGPFECGNCRYFIGGPGGPGCGQADMKRHSRQPRLPDGRVQVDGDDCCEFAVQDRAGETRNGPAVQFGALGSPMGRKRRSTEVFEGWG